MKLPCPHCPKTFDDAEWLKLHISAQHGRERETKQRGKGGGRKAANATSLSSAWVKTAPSSSTLMNHYRPAEKPKFEFEPVNIGPLPQPRNWFTLENARDIVDIYNSQSACESNDNRDKVRKGLISGTQKSGRKRTKDGIRFR